MFKQNIATAAHSLAGIEKTGELDRRGFLRLTVGTGAGLVIGAYLPPSSATMAAAVESAATFNPFVKITPDNKVIVLSKHLDKGQGTATGLATLVAEELDADWSQMVAEFAPANAGLYKNLFFGVQGTGGSTAMANSFEQYRKAGAAARQMLIEAAAGAWKTDASQVTVANGVLTDGTNKATFGELAAAAAKMPLPDNPKLKDPKDFVYIGKSFPRLDQKAKVAAAQVFTQDLRLSDMRVAVVARPPRFGGKPGTVDSTKAKAIKGVQEVVTIPGGVAVIANSTWAAIKGREALKIDWDESAAERRGTSELIEEYRALAGTPGLSVRKDGDAVSAIAGAKSVIDAEFVFPFLAHAPMEPLNAVLAFKDGKATLWSGSQLQTIDQSVVAAILGIRPEDVTINTQWAGGSFGRRAVYNADYVAEVANIVKALGTEQPVKLVWTREDDIKGGYYRPMYVHKVRVGLTETGEIAGWQHRVVGQSIMDGTAFADFAIKNGIDETSVEGVHTTPYAIPNFEVELHSPKFGAPPLWWRSVGHTHTAYVMETLIDEIAGRAGQDPVAFRLKLLEKHPRHAAVLKLAAEKAGWGTPLSAGVARGVAVHESFKSYVAQVAEVRIQNGRAKVDRIVCAVDCGLAINPDNIAAQIEGGIGYGLGAVLHSKVTLTDGVVDQSNFGDYEVLRFSEMPRVEVHIVPSAAPPTGIGEPGTPPAGPAVANAIAALTGVRIRSLPMATHKLVQS
jgi:isoquinoline 1-oxidoreductase beta subunit